MGNAIKDLNVSALNCLVELQKSTADVCALRKREKAGAKTPHGCFAFDTSELSGPQIRPLRSRIYLATRGGDDDDDGDVMLSPSLSCSFGILAINFAVSPNSKFCSFSKF